MDSGTRKRKCCDANHGESDELSDSNASTRVSHYEEATRRKKCLAAAIGFMILWTESWEREEDLLRNLREQEKDAARQHEVATKQLCLLQMLSSHVVLCQSAFALMLMDKALFSRTPARLRRRFPRHREGYFENITTPNSFA